MSWKYADNVEMHTAIAQAGVPAAHRTGCPCGCALAVFSGRTADDRFVMALNVGPGTEDNVNVTCHFVEDERELLQILAEWIAAGAVLPVVFPALLWDLLQRFSPDDTAPNA